MFGANQHEDPTADKYHIGLNAHGDGDFQGKKVPDSLNDGIVQSLDGRPMTWSLWNAVRHYVYIKWFKNVGKSIEDDADWDMLERRTKKIVRGIYRTFKEKQKTDTFGSIDGSYANCGEVCAVKWTNSFVQISSILERNAREHDASLVMFTGDIRQGAGETSEDIYQSIKSSPYNFVANVLDGLDSEMDGIRPPQSEE